MALVNDMKILADKLDREHEIYLGLRKLSRRQMEVIEQEKGVDQLLGILGRKQLLISELEGIGREVAPLKRGWMDQRESMDPAARTAVETRLLAIRGLIEELLDLEDRGRLRLQERQKGIAAEIGKITRSRQAQQAYGGGRRLPLSDLDDGSNSHQAATG
jgi:flagellar biosynthesis/type III secretory pathway chaperone